MLIINNSVQMRSIWCPETERRCAREERLRCFERTAGPWGAERQG